MHSHVGWNELLNIMHETSSLFTSTYNYQSQLCTNSDQNLLFFLTRCELVRQEFGWYHWRRPTPQRICSFWYYYFSQSNVRRWPKQRIRICLLFQPWGKMIHNLEFWEIFRVSDSILANFEFQWWRFHETLLFFSPGSHQSSHWNERKDYCC